jgi:hypothetical protein
MQRIFVHSCRSRSRLAMKLRSFLADAIEIILRSNKQLPMGDRRGGIAFIVEGILADDVESAVALEDLGDAVVIGDVDVAIGQDR